MPKQPSKKTAPRKPNAKDNPEAAHRPIVGRPNRNSEETKKKGSPPCVPELVESPNGQGKKVSEASHGIPLSDRKRAAEARPGQGQESNTATAKRPAIFSPRKGRQSSSAGGGTKYVDSIFTETAGKYGEYIVVTVERQNGDAGWMNDLYNPIPEVLKEETTWDVRVPDFLHLRESREKNLPVPCAKTGRSRSYNRFGIASFPEKEKIMYKHGLKNPYSTHDARFYEKLLRDEVETELRKGNLARREANLARGMSISTVYAPWDPKRHSKTAITDGEYKFRALDHIFVDTAVGKIILSYYDDEYPQIVSDKGATYGVLVKLGVEDTYFSRGADGKYSHFARTTLGYPDDEEEIICRSQEGGAGSDESRHNSEPGRSEDGGQNGEGDGKGSEQD